MHQTNALPLAGLKVVEFCTTVAGPACARLLADFGADVIKIEPPGGDPVRQMGYHFNDVALYTASLLRGKRSIVLDLKQEKCVEIAASLVEQADFVVENYRPGVLERLGLGYEAMSVRNPGLIMIRISGYGQYGPYAERPGYGAICEAVAGVRHMTGDPDRPPARVALPTTDYFTSVFAAYGAMVALHERHKTGRGQVVDAALYEAAFTQMETIVPAYDKLKVVPKREGPNLASMAPNSLYATRDGKYFLIAANNAATWKRLVMAMEQPELETDPRFATIRERGKSERIRELNAIVEAWTCQFDARDLERRLLAAQVPCSLVYTIEDIYQDEHYQAREMLVRVPHPTLGHTTQIGVVPRLSRTPGTIRRTGPVLGQDTASVLKTELGWSDEAIRSVQKLCAEQFTP